MSRPPPRLFCIDASIYIFRAYFSLPDRWFNAEGYSLNAVHGYTRFLVNFVRETRPLHLMGAYGDIAGIYRNLDALPESGIRSAARIQQALAEHREQLLLARQLTGLYNRAIKARTSKVFAYRAKTRGLGDYLTAVGCSERWTASIVNDLEGIA